jgi:hypothetical protein
MLEVFVLSCDCKPCMCYVWNSCSWTFCVFGYAFKVICLYTYLNKFPKIHNFRRVRNIAKGDCSLRHVCPHGTTGLLWTDVHKTWNLGVVQKYAQKIQVWLKSEKNNRSNWHEDLCTFMIISLWILLRMKTLLDNICRENQNTFYFLQFFPKIMPFMR